MKYALKSVPGLADIGVLLKSTQMSASKARNFGLKATSLVLAGRSGMDKNPPLDFSPFLLCVDDSSQCTARANAWKSLLEAFKGQNSKKGPYHVDQHEKLKGDMGQRPLKGRTGRGARGHKAFSM